MRERFRSQQQQQHQQFIVEQQQQQQQALQQIPYHQRPQGSSFVPQNQFMNTPPSDSPAFVGPSSNAVENNNSEPMIDDADVAAGKVPTTTTTMTTTTSQPLTSIIKSSNVYKKTKFTDAPFSEVTASLVSLRASDGASTSGYTHPSDLEFFEDLVSEPVLVLGVDISHLDRNTQYLVCAAGVFGFSLLYGYLQELISVRLCGRQLGLFLAMVQFTGYTILAFVLRNFVYAKQQRQQKRKRDSQRLMSKKSDGDDDASGLLTVDRGDGNSSASPVAAMTVPLLLYFGLSILRAIDLAMTNMAMQYINYPAKTLMKSSRVVFTMLFGVIISRKSYKLADFGIVFAMVSGLAIFMHADANSSAIFDLLGVFMLIISLLCDGAISNVSETIMNKFGVGQDEFIFRMYSIALIAITIAATLKGDMKQGLIWLLQPGTYDELGKPIEERTWTVLGKITVIVLFSSMGFFGSSCSAAITKNFGALTMSITSTARKASTLFLSFFLFNNVCTWEHLLGVIIFIAALTAKSLRRSKSGRERAREIMRQQRKIRKQQLRRTGSYGGPDSAESSVSDVSDVELCALGEYVTCDNVPSVVHTDTLRIRPVSSSSPVRQQLQSERRNLVGVI